MRSSKQRSHRSSAPRRGEPVLPGRSAEGSFDAGSASDNEDMWTDEDDVDVLDTLDEPSVLEKILKQEYQPGRRAIYNSLDRSNMNEDLDVLISDFLGFLDNRMEMMLATTSIDYRNSVRDLFCFANYIIREPSLHTIQLHECFKDFCLNVRKTTPKELVTTYSKITGPKSKPVADPVQGTKRRNSIPINKFEVLENEVDLDKNPPKILKDSDNRTNPFFIEINGDWTIIAKTIVDMLQDKPSIKLAGPLLKVITKNSDDFRKLQNYLDTNNFKFTTLNPANERPKKILIRGLPCYTEQQLIIQSLAKEGFTATRASMLKNRKTGAPMPLYMVNILPTANFEKIYEITEIAYLSITIEHFRANGPKQCYRCQNFGHASEMCRLTPRCLKCAGEHITLDCPHKGKINPKCANCGLGHVATYRGCDKNPINNKKFMRKNQTSIVNQAKTQKPSPKQKIDSDLANILNIFNYTKNHNDNSKPSEKPAEKPAPQSSNYDKDFPSLNAQDNTNAKSKQNDKSNGNSGFFQDLQYFIQLGKNIISIIKNISTKIKNASNPMDKFLVILKEFESLSSLFA